MPGMEASISSMREQLSQKNPHIISLAMSSPLSESLHSSRVFFSFVFINF